MTIAFLKKLGNFKYKARRSAPKSSNCISYLLYGDFFFVKNLINIVK